MRKPISTLAMAAVLIATVGLCAPEAHAQVRHQGSRVIKSGSSSSRSRSTSRSAPTFRGSSSRSRSAPSSRGSSSRGGSSPFGRSGSSRSSGSSRGSRSGNSGLGNLGSLGDVISGIENATRGGGFDPYGYGDRNRGRDDYADAYREVGIAHAVVNLIGIIAETSTANQALRQAQPVAAAPATRTGESRRPTRAIRTIRSTDTRPLQPRHRPTPRRRLHRNSYPMAPRSRPIPRRIRHAPIVWAGVQPPRWRPASVAARRRAFCPPSLHPDSSAVRRVWPPATTHPDSLGCPSARGAFHTSLVGRGTHNRRGCPRVRGPPIWFTSSHRKPDDSRSDPIGPDDDAEAFLQVRCYSRRRPLHRWR